MKNVVLDNFIDSRYGEVKLINQKENGDNLEQKI